MKSKLSRALLRSPVLQLPALRAYSWAKAVTSGAGAAKIQTNEKFLFIVGCGRSGNTLLRRLIVEQLPVYIPAETYGLGPSLSDFVQNRSGRWEGKVNAILSSFEYHPEYPKMCRSGLASVAQKCKNFPKHKRTYGNVVAEMFRHFADEAQCEYAILGDKTPTNTNVLGLLNKAFPNSKFLFISRDPYDVTLSYLKMGRYKTASEAANRWLDAQISWTRFSNLIPDEKKMDLSYEDLVRTTSTVIDEIAHWLNLPKRTASLPENFFWGDIDQLRHHAKVLGKISENSIGKGYMELDESQRHEVTRIIGDVFQYGNPK